MKGVIDTTKREKKSAADLQQYKDLYLAGKSQTEIAAATGFSKAKCSRLKKKLLDQDASIPSQKPDNLQILQSLIRKHAARFSRMTDSATQEYKKHAGQIDDIDMGMLAMWQCTFMENDILRQLEILLHSPEKDPERIEEIQESITGAEALLLRANKRAIMQPVVPWNWSNGDSDDQNNEQPPAFTLSAHQAFYLKRREDLLHDLEGLKKSIETVQTMIDEIQKAEKAAQRKEREQTRLRRERARAEQELLYQPTGHAILQSTRVFEAGNKITELPERSKVSSPEAEMSVYNLPGYKEENRFVAYKRGNNSVTTRVEDIGEISGNNLAAIKTFIYALTTAGQEAVYPDGSIRQCFTVYYSELAKNGIYTSEDAARHHAYKAAQKLQQLSISGYHHGKSLILQPENLEKSLEDTAGFFSVISRVKNGIRFTLNPGLDWGAIFSAYAPLPATFFRLPSLAALLLWHVCQLLQQRGNKIKKDGMFKVSIRTVAAWLFLPFESETSNPTVTIKNPIFEAANMINDTDEHGIYLEVEEPGINYTISEFLDKGKLKVSIIGAVLERVIEKATKKQKKIKAKEDRNKRIEEKARVNYRTKELEREAAAGKAGKS